MTCYPQGVLLCRVPSKEQWAIRKLPFTTTVTLPMKHFNALPLSFFGVCVRMQ